ncbi:hypothetical protein EDB83DRAFT_2310143 [Lactarius deliciosus]|nr:hypothetical protein EDB83DRAFT_2310143 [Lactarius deliciosus]
MNNHIDDDSHSDVESDIFSLRSALSSATSYDVSMRSGSPAPSVYSVTSSIRAASYRQEYGRGLNNCSEVYRLPADDEELDRLDCADKQHEVFKKIIGAYPPPMAEVMDDTPWETKSVLDLGCGSGSWIMDVARDFPHCQAVAVDLITSANAYVLVGLWNFSSPILGSTIRISNPFPYPQESWSRQWFPRWMSFCNMAVRQRGGSPNAGSMVYNRTLQHPAFDDVVYQDYFIPTAPFMPSDDPKYDVIRSIAETLREDILSFLRSGRPLLLGSGLPESLVDELQQHTHLELKEARTVSYIRLERVYARKKP